MDTDHLDIIVDSGGPLGRPRQASAAGIRDTSNNLGGFVKLQVESHEAAGKWFENHPSSVSFPGEG